MLFQLNSDIAALTFKLTYSKILYSDHAKSLKLLINAKSPAVPEKHAELSGECLTICRKVRRHFRRSQ